MAELFCEHYSHRFALKLNKLPARATDRFSRVILFIGFFAGLALCLLGLFYFVPDFLTGAVDIEKGMPKVQHSVGGMISAEKSDIFNAVFILTGLGIIYTVIVKFIRYKKVIFDGNEFTVKHRPFWGEKKVFSEPLYNYLGVRLRIKFYQFGIITRNKYIIELYHRDVQKIVPLYITTCRKNIRKIWKNYAQMLQMPGIMISEKGMISYNFKDLDVPYAEVVKKWHLPKNFAYDLEKPAYMTFKSNLSGDKIIKISKYIWDAFSFLNACTVILLGALLIFSVNNYQIMLLHLPFISVWSFYALLATIILYSFLNLTTKDVIITKNGNIYIFRKVMFLKIGDGVIPFHEIKGIDINYMPTMARYYLSIVTVDNNYVVGCKLSAEDLRWLRAVLINEIIGN